MWNGRATSTYTVATWHQLNHNFTAARRYPDDMRPSAHTAVRFFCRSLARLPDVPPAFQSSSSPSSSQSLGTKYASSSSSYPPPPRFLAHHVTPPAQPTQKTEKETETGGHPNGWSNEKHFRAIAVCRKTGLFTNNVFGTALRAWEPNQTTFRVWMVYKIWTIFIRHRRVGDICLVLSLASTRLVADTRRHTASAAHCTLLRRLR